MSAAAARLCLCGAVGSYLSFWGRLKMLMHWEKCHAQSCDEGCDEKDNQAHVGPPETKLAPSEMFIFLLKYWKHAWMNVLSLQPRL